MDIQINNENEKNMKALLINDKDGLAMTISDPTNDSLSTMTHFTVYALDPDGVLSDSFQSDACSDTKFDVVRHSILHGDPDIYLSGDLYFAHVTSKTTIHLHNLSLDCNLDIYKHTLYHAINMLRGFFVSRKYHDFVKNTKRGKLIAKKQKLNREISKIDKQLNA